MAIGLNALTQTYIKIQCYEMRVCRAVCHVEGVHACVGVCVRVTRFQRRRLRHSSLESSLISVSNRV
jgi:hypothetical protein